MANSQNFLLLLQPKKSHLSLQNDGSRSRAYSCGSQRKVNNPMDLLKKDPRTGAKSSSAPLLNNRPPRMRASTSRGDVGEDLMEIDYNKTKYSVPEIDFSESFTIEPVGRARSGSYSSSSNSALKLFYNNKIKSQSTGHSSNSVKDEVDAVSSDYLAMSPINDQGKSTKISNTSKNDQISKKLEALHPPGDYVSLDPSCTVREKYHTGNVNTSERTNTYSMSQNSMNHPFSTSPLSRINDCESSANTPAFNKEALNGGVSNTSLRESERQSSSDYMCMNYSQDLAASVPSPPNSHSFNSVSISEKKELTKNSTTQQGKELKPTSPISKTAPHTSAANYVPQTPPPSPSYGPYSSPLSSFPLVDNVMRRLSQPIGPAIATLNSGEIRLNYASLDLPPASEEDPKGNTGKLKKSGEDEAKESALTYAQIDFSPVRQKAFQESESLSHL